MSNTSTLFDDFDDDDDEPPPNLRPGGAKKEIPKPAVTQAISPIKTQPKSPPQEIDPFDLNNFDQSVSKVSVRDNNVSPNFGTNDDMIISIKSMKVKGDKIIDYSSVINQLKEELRIKKEEINRLNSQLNAKNACSDVSFAHMNENLQQSGYHLAFLFSSPLVRKINSNLEMIMQLDYTNEIKGIEKQLKHVKHEIKYKVDVATISNFRSVIADAPFALHFTGHGVQNNQNALGTAYMQYKDRGDILLLEDENGMADYLFENDLKKLVQISNANREFWHNYEVVFVSSCYSEFTAKIFLASGARHVICIQKNQRISDKASLRFSQVFYETLFVK